MSIKNFGYEDEILKFIYTNFNGKVVSITDLKDIVTSKYPETSSDDSPFKQKLMDKKEVITRRKMMMISLTKNGKQAVEQLKKAEVISKGKRLPATNKCQVILYLYRNGPKAIKEINEGFPGSTGILMELVKLKEIKEEINSSKYPLETALTSTEKRREIGLKLDEVERMMEE